MTSDAEPLYHCPDERQPISRALHLGRLARFYAGCRECAHCHDTGALSPRLVRQLQRSFARPKPASPWSAEGLAGACPQAITPGLIRQAARAFGCEVRERVSQRILSDSSGATAGLSSSAENTVDAAPVVALGGDGRLLTAELHSAAAEGLRWSGCEVVDLGAIPGPVTPLAIDCLQAAGGLALGNPLGRPETVGLKFWLPGARPVSAGPLLERLAIAAAGHLDRPTRRFGPARRFDATEPYRDELAGFYHALRPLRVAIYSASGPAFDCLRALAQNVACTFWPLESAGDAPRVIRSRGAHLGAAIDDDGECLRLWDERGEPVADERLLILLSRPLLAVEPGAIVLAEPAAQGLASTIERLHGRPVEAAASRQAVDAAMRAQQAAIGFGPGPRFWRPGGNPAADALYAFSRLLVLLSRSDRRFSETLDAEAVIE